MSQRLSLKSNDKIAVEQNKENEEEIVGHFFKDQQIAVQIKLACIARSRL